MTAKKKSTKPVEMPPSLKKREIEPPVDPEEPVISEEGPGIIPDEDPFENPPPFEIPEPGEGP
jgi:hypothetical protein